MIFWSHNNILFALSWAPKITCFGGRIDLTLRSLFEGVLPIKCMGNTSKIAKFFRTFFKDLGPHFAIHFELYFHVLSDSFEIHFGREDEI